MPLLTIPRNTYPLAPTGYAPYWQAGKRQPTEIRMTGKVPLWVTFHDGGLPGRIQHVMIVRVRPDLEVVLVGKFRDEIIDDKIEAAIQNRRSKARWPERSWWVSHVVYLAQPPKRQASKKSRRFNFKRFCMGSLVCSDHQSRMLAFVPVSRLKLNVLPYAPAADSGTEDAPDLSFQVDTSNQQQKSIRAYLTKLAELERWERNLVSRAMCHLLGRTYIEALMTASENIVGGDFTVNQKTFLDAHHSNMQSKPEAFRPIRWLQTPENDDDKRCRQMTLTITRFPMGNGPDPEMSVRPWIPEELRQVLSPRMPVEPYSNMCLQIAADSSNRDLSLRWIINPLVEYEYPPSTTGSDNKM
ncbi:MAG TPA: hypothetical protein P5081_01770 [Phycisphaerae bacterium]|nr:hypothetical protein [Phycisphaerae bacterium]